MRRLPLLLAATLAFTVLAGCAEEPAPSNGDATFAPQTPSGSSSSSPPGQATGTQRPAPAARDEVTSMHLRGNVLDEALAPIVNATVTLVGAGNQTTRDDGAFDFGTRDAGLYTLTATAAGYQDGAVTVAPGETEQRIRLVLLATPPTEPYNVTIPFRGNLECALEVLIISPSCDSALTVVPGAPRLFDEDQSFLFDAEPNWKTLVLDVVFDADAHPGLDGLRVALRGSIDPDAGGEYSQYGRWSSPESFTIRVEPLGAYDDGTEPVPANATGFQVDVYPHSHLWHTAGVSPFLGVGAALNVRFDVYATLFYVEPAPEGYTFQGA